MTFREVYQEWLVYKKRQVKASTLCAYNLICITHLIPAFGGMDITNLDKKTVKKWLFEKLDTGNLTTKTLHDMLIVIKMIVNYAGEELDQDVPSTSWKMIWPTANKSGASELERYNHVEYKKIVEHCLGHPSPRNLGILIAICTGMRIGEVCALQFGDINITDKTIHVSRTIERIYHMKESGEKYTTLEIGTPKTVNSDRIIPIASNIIKMVKNFSSVALPEYYVCTCGEKPTEPRTYRNYYKDLIKKEIKLDRVLKFHALRHTFASTLIENGVDAKTVSSLLGHSDVSTTLNVYVHPTQENKRNAVKKGLNKIFK